MLRNRNFNRPVVVAVGMLDVDPSPAFVEWVEVQAGELRSQRAIRCPPRETLTRIRKIPVPVQVLGNPDVVTFATCEVFNDVDVPILVDRKVVDVGQTGADRGASREVDGESVGDHRDRVLLQVEPVRLVGRGRRHIEVVHSTGGLNLHVLGALVVRPLERRQVRRVASIDRLHAIGVGDGDCSGQRGAGGVS